MKIFPRSSKEIETISTMRALRACICDEMQGCTNVYSPKYKELKRLYTWVEKNVPDKRIH
jgi:hypothetical protein